MKSSQSDQYQKANSPEEMLDLVDKNDQILGVINREIANKDPKYTHREVAVILVDENNKLLIQKRSEYKSVHPSMWSLTAGHISAGEDPEETAYAELEEELGLTGIDLKFLVKRYNEYSHESHFMYYFIGNYSGEKINFEEAELSEVKFVSESDLEEMIKNSESINLKHLPVLKKVWDKDYKI